MLSIKLSEIINEFCLEDITKLSKTEDVIVTTSDVNRPGLQLAGFMNFFGNDRLQIVGKVETEYLSILSPDERRNRLDNFFKCGFPGMIIARGLEVFKEMLEVALKYEIPLLRTNEITSVFMSSLIKFLNVELAPRANCHGGLVEVHGEGILILGDSGVGKSETALELVKRGHRLVADDVVEIRKVSDTTLVGTAADIIRHLIEIRGIGIVDVMNIYGVGSVKMTENINLVLHLERWDQNKNYERLGLVDKFTEIMGIQIPSLDIPVKPGRNLAIIAEVAAMNNRLKKMGYNAARELNERVMWKMNKNSNKNV